MKEMGSGVGTGHAVRLTRVWPGVDVVKQEGGEGEGESVWECVLDRASNGMSIELLAAAKRWDGKGYSLTAVSKSSGQNLRVWDMGPNATGGKDVTYRDVSNTQVGHTMPCIAWGEQIAVRGRGGRVVAGLMAGRGSMIDWLID